MPILGCENVTKRFGGLTALSNVSFTVEKRELVGLIGPNGSGKTTLFNCISGFYRSDKGKITFYEKEITRLRPHTVCKLGISRTFQLVRPFLDLTVMENVRLGRMFGRQQEKGTAHPRRELLEILELVGIAKLADSLVANLTTNDRKKLELAKALAGTPRLLLLDEIITGLTPTEANEMVRLIQRIREEYVEAILMVEHIMRIIMNISDRVIVLNHGELIAQGTPAEIKQEKSVIEAYMGRGHVGTKEEG